MRVVILGLPQSGRTMLWKMLSGEHIGHKENLSVVKLPDYRLYKIAEIYNSKKIFPIEIELQDSIGDIFHGGAIFSDTQGANGIIITVRGFDGGFGKPVPDVDAQKIADSLRLYDASSLETRRKTLDKDRKKGHSREERRQFDMELSTIEKFTKLLEENKNIRSEELSEYEWKIARNQGFLTAKPWLVVLATEEPADEKSLNEVSKILDAPTIWLATKLEREFLELEPDEAAMFREELQIPENMLDNILLSLYDAMNFIEFYTGNEKDARAWAIKNGTTAIEAADKIHSDISRGFIRAEIIQWDKLVEVGGYDAAKAKSMLRVEGKDYVMQDGDYAYFRFNV